uniref:Uncharacterized protein n=1 Tax=viral metagenome TaxID=1070528 RepID=A0A6H1ZR45_9ZZZZ
MDLQEQLEIGKQAEDFLKYLAEHPYFEGLLERVKLEYARQILELMPDRKEAFSLMKSEMLGIDEIMNAVRGDIYLASEALKKLSGEEDKGGLL